MKRFLILCLVTLLFSCKSYESLISDAWKKYEIAEYENADKLFSKALFRIGSKAKAFEGKAFTSYQFKDYEKAEFYIFKAFKKLRTSKNIYNYALFSNLNNHQEKSMKLLFDLSSREGFNQFITLAKKEEGFQSLKDSNPKFNRLLKGIRRIKIDSISAYSFIADGIGHRFNKNDLFVIIKQDDKTILKTDIVEGNNNPTWYYTSLILDYKIGTEFTFLLKEDDIQHDDTFINEKRKINYTGDLTFYSRKTRLTVKISDTEEKPILVK